MEPAGSSPVTGLLVRSKAGSREALDRAVLLVDRELRRIAHRATRSKRPGYTLRATALLNVVVDPRCRAKRADVRRLPLDEWLLHSPAISQALLILDEILSRLAGFARVVQLRYLAGISVESVAGAIEIHTHTVIHQRARGGVVQTRTGKERSP